MECALTGRFFMASKKIIFRIFSTPFIILAFVSFLISSFFWVQSHSAKSTDTNLKRLVTQLPISPTPESSAVSPSAYPTDITVSIPSITPHSQNPQSSPTAKAALPAKSVITVRLEEPKGNFKFTLFLPDGANPCSVLNSLKEAGKLESLDVTHYGPPLNSDYVKEIDGYRDNWTFDINGEKKPAGCTNYILSAGATVTWKFN